MSSVAFVGLGAMGSRMARRLLDAGHEVAVWNRSAERAATLIERGAIQADSPSAAAARADALITMVSNPAALRAVSEGAAGIAAGAGESLTVIEMSTVGPSAIARLESELPQGTGLLDAPVLGSLSEAESGSLKIFIGGPGPLAERWSPLLSTLGAPLYIGPLGAGAKAKLVANNSLLGMLGLLGETLLLAEAMGLSRSAAFEVLATTPLAAQAERRRPAIEARDYPARFSLPLARKDADLVAAAASDAGIELRLAAAVRAWFAGAEAAGLHDRDYSAILDHILSSRPAGPLE